MRFLQEIEDAREYSRKLLRCLNESGRQWQILGAHDKEKEIRRNPWAVVHWEVKAPPFVQSLFWELINLENYAHELRNRREVLSLEYRQTRIRQIVIQLLIDRWLRLRLLRRPRVKSLFEQKKATAVIGGRWKILFVQYFQVALSVKKDSGT
ncbi:MAG: hypothetical protein QG653_444 [Patescibacteria group bacterium]|nr:hypothetical protein [Patescibacteria group bacterium]